MCQCSRSSPNSRAASAVWAVRLVMPWTTSTVVLPFSVRSRVRSKPCFRPGHRWCKVRISVVRSVRFSRRPWPLSPLVATRPGDVGTSGGKSSGHRLDRCLEAEAGVAVDRQSRLVILDDEHVVAAGLGDRRADVTLAEHGVADDYSALDRQNA